MNITVCPDSYKGSLPSNEVAKIMTQCCYSIFPSATVFEKPMADGGEGTIEALVHATEGKIVHVNVTNALGERTRTFYGVDRQKNIAFIEIANIAGLEQVPENKRNPYDTTSYGLGEMLRHVINKGYKKIIVGLGGSSTNDGGLGFLQALGVKFFDANNRELNYFGKSLLQVERVDFSQIDQRIYDVDLKIASDVNNPLCGEKGASAIFGPQKGATKEQIKHLDSALNDYGDLVEKELNYSFKFTPGAGAAGGLGFALLCIGGKLISGAELVAKTINLEEAIRKSQLIITGEGRSDRQTLYGKAPGYVAELGEKHRVPILLLSGAIEDNEELLDKFTAVFSIVNKPMSLEDAIENVESLLESKLINILNFYKALT